MRELELVIVTPEGVRERLKCDSVTAFARDNEKGENGGGFGIRPGHLPLVAALQPGSRVRAEASGKTVGSFTVMGGFLSVKSDIVTVISESVS